VQSDASRTSDFLFVQEQRAILDAFLQLLGDEDSRLRGFLNTMCPANDPPPGPGGVVGQSKLSFVETFRIKVGTFLCVRFATQSRHQRWGVGQGSGVRKPHGTLGGIKGFHGAMPWLLRLDSTTTYQDILEFLPVHTIEKTRACRVEMTLILPEEVTALGVRSVLQEHHVVSLAPIREQLLQEAADRAQKLVVRETLRDLKAANKEIHAANKVLKEQAKEERDQCKMSSKEEKKQKKNQAKAALEAGSGQKQETPRVVKALNTAAMTELATGVGNAERAKYLRENSLMDVLVVEEGALRGARRARANLCFSFALQDCG